MKIHFKYNTKFTLPEISVYYEHKKSIDINSFFTYEQPPFCVLKLLFCIWSKCSVSRISNIIKKKSFCKFSAQHPLSSKKFHDNKQVT